MASKAPPILIVDDNVEFASLLGTLFSEQSLVPILAHTAANALTLYKVYQPRAVIVDLLLPDMTGHKLLTALKHGGSPELFVITGVFKGQGQLERVRAIAPLAGWFEKPFDTRVLVEQVVKAIGANVVRREAHRAVESITPDFDINILDPVEAEGIRVPLFIEHREVTPEIDIDLDESAMSAYAHVGEELSIEVEDLGAELDAHGGTEHARSVPTVPIGRIDPRRASQSSPISQISTGSLPPLSSFVHGPQGTPGSQPSRPALAATPLPAARTPSGFAVETSPTPEQLRGGLRAKMRTGPLRSATVSRLLTAFHLSQETGEIAFERKQERKVVHFAEGRPVYARSNQDIDRIGSIAKRAYGLSGAQLERALELARRSDRMLGEVLIEQRMIPESSRQELLREQTRSIIRSLLTWTDGRYVIGFNARPNDLLRVELDDHPAALVMQGVRELFDVERLRTLVPDRMRPMPSPNAPYELHELPMGDAEAMLLLRSTGARNVRALLDELAPRLTEQDVRAHLYGLLVLGMLFAGRATKEVTIP